MQQKVIVIYYEIRGGYLVKQQKCVRTPQITVDMSNFLDKMKIRCRTKDLLRKDYKGGNDMTGGTLFLVIIGAAYVTSWLFTVIDIIDGKHRMTR